MNRRKFIQSLAAALPAGAVATQVRAETDPVRAAYMTLCAALDAEAATTGRIGWSTHATSRGDQPPVLGLSYYKAEGGLEWRNVEGFRQVA